MLPYITDEEVRYLQMPATSRAEEEDLPDQDDDTPLNVDSLDDNESRHGQMSPRSLREKLRRRLSLMSSASTITSGSRYQSALDLQEPLGQEMQGIVEAQPVLDREVSPERILLLDNVKLQENKLASPSVLKNLLNGQFLAMSLEKEVAIFSEGQLKFLHPGDADQFFNDGIRRIDFVLAFNPVDKRQSMQSNEKRLIFEENLVDEGLQLEYDTQDGGQVWFVKIHAPWEVLSRYAEIMKIKMPMKQGSDGEEENSKFSQCMKSLTKRMLSRCQLDQNLFPSKKRHFSHIYSRDKEYLFSIPKKREDFFPPAIRSQIVDFILRRKRFSTNPTDDFAFGIRRLLNEGAYTAAYPLHEGSIKDSSNSNNRQLLYQHWSQFKVLFKMQPLDQIRTYFGDKVGLYFAWLGFYTWMLLPASVVGLVCFLYGCFTLCLNIPSNDICNKELNITMCPVCDKLCDYWKLEDTCLHAKFSYLFDNPATVFFAVFMAIWGTVFMELWKRYRATIEFRWDLVGWDEEEEHPRPEYLAKLSNSKRKKLNVVTKMMEPSVSFWQVKFPRLLISGIMIFFLVFLAVAAVVAVVVYRVSMMAVLAIQDDRSLYSYASLLITITAAVLNLVAILLLNMVYDRVAVYLTEMEMLRTQLEFENSLTLKMFLLQFVNWFSSIFYIAFFKGRLVGRRDDFNRIFGRRQEECEPGGCLIELCFQLAIIMVGKQLIQNNIMEIFVPRILKWCNSLSLRRSKSKDDQKHEFTRWEKDYQLQPWEVEGLFSDYLELVLQFGFLTIFVAAFPLAPLFALINNLIEIRVDADKFITQSRRPVAQRAYNIGIWYRIVDSIGKMSVVTNAFVIAFTSDFVPRIVYYLSVSPDGTLRGFMNHSLAYFNISDFQNDSMPLDPYSLGFETVVCRYRDYREPYWSENRYEYTNHWWYILAARLAFIVAFENVVVLVKTLLSWWIPDVPRDVREQIRREHYVTNELIVQKELERAKTMKILWDRSPDDMILRLVQDQELRHRQNLLAANIEAESRF